MYNKPNHLEVPVLDIKKAKSFFTIFGWKDSYMDFQEGQYVLVNGEGENPVSFGFYKADRIPETGIKIVLGVQNIDEKLREVVSAGGKVLTKKYEISSEIGFAAEFKDIFGNTWGLHSPPKND